MTILALVVLAATAVVQVTPRRYGYRVMPEHDWGHVMTWVRLISGFGSLALAIWVVLA